MIAVPQAADQFGNAELLERLGVAKHLAAQDATSEALRSALLEITGSASVQQNLADARAEVRGAGGAAAAADLLEDELVG